MEKTLITTLAFFGTFLFVIALLFAIRQSRQERDPDPFSRADWLLNLARDLTINLKINADNETESAPPSSRHFAPTSTAFKALRLGFTLQPRPSKVINSPTRATTDGRTSYQSDLGNLTCTCSENATRGHYRPGDDRRICRHLMRHLAQRQLIAGHDKWADAIIQHHKGVPIEAWILTLQSAPEILVTRDLGSDWLNIFAHRKRTGERIATATGPIDRHGWSLSEQRWSYGAGPPGAGEARKLLIAATR